MPQDLERHEAEQIIESLRRGVPPRRNVSKYAAGTDFVQSVRRRHLDGGIQSGKIRFVSGSWGSGKTHFFRLLREQAFDANLLVSTVELNSDQTPFNKFERVFYEIVRNITSPSMYEADNLNSTLPLGNVLEEALELPEDPTQVSGVVESKCEQLFKQASIDIDFRRVVDEYWRTFSAVDGDEQSLEDVRGTLLQWFEGEGQASAFRREFGVQKVVTKENAHIILSSLGNFVKWLGFGGLVILFDESEMSHSTMRKSALKQAHNNLLHLINEIDASEGLFMVYAAVPEFYLDERYGIRTYGALSSRIGQPSEKPPKPLDTVWNIDALASTAGDYQAAASRIRDIYTLAYPDDTETLVSDSALRDHVAALVAEHPEFANLSAWRLVITGTVEVLDQSLDGAELPKPAAHHTAIMERLGDD